MLLVVCALVFAPGSSSACPMCDQEKAAAAAAALVAEKPAASAAIHTNCCCAQNGCHKAAGKHAPTCMCNAHQNTERGSADAVPAHSMPSPKLLAMATAIVGAPLAVSAGDAHWTPAAADAQGTRSPLFLLNQVFRI